jgi:hypothetical protein
LFRFECHSSGTESCGLSLKVVGFGTLKDQFKGNNDAQDYADNRDGKVGTVYKQRHVVIELLFLVSPVFHLRFKNLSIK